MHKLFTCVSAKSSSCASEQTDNKGSLHKLVFSSPRVRTLSSRSTKSRPTSSPAAAARLKLLQQARAQTQQTRVTYMLSTHELSLTGITGARTVSSPRNALKLDCLTWRQLCDHVSNHLRAASRLKMRCKQTVGTPLLEYPDCIEGKARSQVEVPQEGVLQCLASLTASAPRVCLCLHRARAACAAW